MRKLLLCLLVLSSCTRVPRTIEPNLCAPPHPKQLKREKHIVLPLPADFSTSPFAELTQNECRQEWAKELMIARAFAEDFDLYRAITDFKRARCLLPSEEESRRLEIDYDIALAYYLGQKYSDVIYTVETTGLVSVDAQFPAFSDLLLILYDSYSQVGNERQAEHILSLMEADSQEHTDKIRLLAALRKADVSSLEERGYSDLMRNYCREKKSVGRAQMLNAVLPGAGYWYVGLKQTAVTALLVNGLFIGTSAHFISNHNPAAAAILLSLESGWYFGGITGAGLAAKSYNERLFSKYADKIVTKEHPFPLMMLKFSF